MLNWIVSTSLRYRLLVLVLFAGLAVLGVQALTRVPWGKTCTYTELARRAGNPRAIRAAASACARNPITFVIPCHRIVAKNGGLGGYYWGLEMKQQLLARESDA